MNDESKRVWYQLAPNLAASGLLSVLDSSALARYCTLWVRWRRAEDFIDQNGEVFTVKDAGGTARSIKPFPQVNAAAKLAMALTRLEAEFGMTPSGRSRIHVDVKQRPVAEGSLASFVRTG